MTLVMGDRNYGVEVAGSKVLRVSHKNVCRQRLADPGCRRAAWPTRTTWLIYSRRPTCTRAWPNPLIETP
jgi:hypothetical protein